MIVTLITDTFNVNNNGTTISAMRFAKALVKEGHTLRIVTCGNPLKSGVDPQSGYEMFYVPELIIPIASPLAHLQNTLFAKPVSKTLEKAIKGSDIVHVYQPWPLGSKAQKIGKKLGIPVIGAFHVQPENITYNIGLGWFPPAAHLVYFLLNVTFYRPFEHIHCPSKFIASSLRKHGYRARLHVISNGVDSSFTPGEAYEKKDDEPFKILMVGRLSAEKRQDILIKAVGKSANAHNIQLYFAGSGPKKKKLEKLGARLPRPPVFGYYNQEELIKLMRSCDLYVHPSDIEIEGISCIEAFACGLAPVISNSRGSATAQFALNKDHLFQAGDSGSLAEKIDYWINNPLRLKEAGKLYSQYAKNYSLERSVKKIEKVYKSAAIAKGKNSYTSGSLYRLFSRLFYYILAAPLLFFWTKIILGVRVVEEKPLPKLKGAVTLCNHVHTLDCIVVDLNFFPRKLVFPTLSENVYPLWPGMFVRPLGGVAIPDNLDELNSFFEEMEFLLMQGKLVHFFPEGELKHYDTSLRDFKKGAFHLAAQARVPIVPMSISFKEPDGFQRLYRRKPTMVLNIGEVIYPLEADWKKDMEIRQEKSRKQMEAMLPRQGYEKKKLLNLR